MKHWRDILGWYDDPLIEAVTMACRDLPVSADTVLDALDDRDKEDLRAGRIPSSQLRAFAKALTRRRAIEAGRVPADFVHQGSCRHCGPVWLPVPADGLNGCPWCRNRLENRNIPRPHGDRHEQAETAIR